MTSRRVVSPAIPPLLCLIAAAAPSCVTKTWRDQALQERADHSTPQLTFETLRAAIRLDDPILAYYTLSEAMKTREKFTLLEFAHGWDVFFQRYPFARFFGNATVDREERVGDLHASIWASAYGHVMRIDFTRQTFFEVKLRNGKKIDGSLGDDLNQNLGHFQNRADVLRGILVDKALENVNVEDIASFQIAVEWKVLGFLEVTGAPESKHSDARSGTSSDTSSISTNATTTENQ